MNAVNVLDAIPEDAKAITNVYYKTWLETYPNNQLGITRDDIEESYKDSFSEENIIKAEKRIQELPSNVKSLVAKVNGLIVGVATMVINKSNNQLKTIYVLPEYQGHGIGKKLWEEARRFCDPTKDIIVQVATYNKNTIEFYKKLGFVDTGKRFTDDKFTFKSGTKLPEMEMVIKAE